ncbi:hypothetical protein Clacol_001719 [Clathrus columnatus]|uniref:Ubiquitin-like domain-containing protein n=1 Tax=Clathrus columnatus TaxID=1419009 RepID=A0AAV4ZYV6_9AGAM|nr:hypothetical protein Clacol_001719 [Clathrus columnatus]
MSELTIQVHLAAYYHSFNVSITSEATILHFKHKITATCPGAPETSGQRIIYKGRVLADTEVIGDIWKSSEGPHVCHLAVHPSAWTGQPPSPPTAQYLDSPPSIYISAPSQQQNNESPSLSAITPPSYMPSYPRVTYPYIQYMHTNALRILAGQVRIAWPSEYGAIDIARTTARQGVEASLRGWPSFLNADFPTSSLEEATKGVRYIYTTIELVAYLILTVMFVYAISSNLPYLSLQNPGALPTSLQSHAIRVLSYTFPLLCVYSSTEMRQYSNPIQVNPPPRPLAPFPVQAQPPQPAPQAAIPLRPLILPFLMLTIRTAFLVYFFQPARKPIFGFFVLIWLMWEVMNVLRGVLRGVNQGENNNANNNDGLRGLNQPANQLNRVPGRNNRILGDSQETLMNYFAHFNLTAEAQFVEPTATPNPSTPPPTLSYRIKTFFILLFLTSYPGLWDRRRTALRVRETRVRDEANTREARAAQRTRERSEREDNRRRGLAVEDEPETSADEPPPPPKPYWVAEYIRRVRSGDWVDDT